MELVAESITSVRAVRSQMYNRTRNVVVHPMRKTVGKDVVNKVGTQHDLRSFRNQCSEIPEDLIITHRDCKTITGICGLITNNDRLPADGPEKNT